MALDKREFEEQFMKLYETGISTTEICKQLGENRRRGYNLLRKKGLKSTNQSVKFPPDFLAKLKEEYLAGATIQQLAEKYPDKGKGGINFHLRKMGITRRNGKQVHCNEHYFDIIDTPSKAYFLGLLMADGSVHNYRKGQKSYTIRIELKIEDKYIIEEFAKAIKSNLQVKEYQEKGIKHCYNGKEYISDKHNAYFATSSYPMGQALCSWGCDENKSRYCVVPNIDKSLMRYFLLGFYDGDGIACATDKTQYMGFVGNRFMLESIVKTVEQEIGVPAPTIHYNRFSHIYFVQYYHIEHQEQIFHYFYDNIDIPHLKRKHIKMQKALKI